jgi:glycosyltransferase involved in cell wall biosynthesis
VNDGSTDGSAEILREYAAKDRRVRMIDFPENRGASAARNAGIDAARGEYIGFVDSDDKIDNNFYEVLYRKAQESKADITKGNLLLSEDQGLSYIHEYRNLNEVRENKVSFMHIPTSIFLTSFIRDNKIKYPVGIRKGEDCVFEVKSSIVANKIEIVEAVSYHYLRRPDSADGSVYNTETVDSLICASKMVFAIAKESNIAPDAYAIIASYRLNELLNWAFQRCNRVENRKKLIKAAYDIYTSTPKKYKDKLYGYLLSKNINSFKYIISYKFEQIFNHMEDEYVDEFKHISDISTVVWVNEVDGADRLIPKIIHYVWPGRDKKNRLASYCIKNWREKLPSDWEIKEWNLDTFDFDKHIKRNKFFDKIYRRRMFAYIADYIRTYVLYEYGGIYLDTDVTIIKKFDSGMLACKMFFPIQNERLVEPAIWGSSKEHPFLKAIMDVYNEKIWQIPEFTFPDIVGRLLKEKYKLADFPSKGNQKIFSTLDSAITFYPEEYFIPARYGEKFLPSCITDKTTTIHWFGASWTKDIVNLEFLKNKDSEFRAKLRENGKKVSLIIPVYNVEAYLPKCLKSVIAQTYKNLEIICVNDASRDKCNKILETYAEEDHRIKIVTHLENRGLSAARNTGLDNVTGEYICFLDGDDWIDNDYIEKLAIAIEQSGTDIVMNTNIVMENENGTNEKIKNWNFFDKEIGIDRKGFFPTKDKMYYLFHNPYLQIYKKNFLDKISVRFPEGLIREDCCFTLMVLPHIDIIYLINDSTYHYLHRSTSIMHSSGAKLADIITVWDKIYDYYLENNFLDKFKIDFANTSLSSLEHIVSTEYDFQRLKNLFMKIKNDILSRKYFYKDYELQYLNDILECNTNDIFKTKKMPNLDKRWKNEVNYQLRHNIFPMLRKRINDLPVLAC